MKSIVDRNTEPKARLIIVDDEPEFVEELASYLTSKGFPCETSLDANDALKKIVKTPEIAIVITDIHMPGIDGLEMVKYLHNFLPPNRHLKFIIVTGHLGAREITDSRDLGVFGFLSKPFAPQELLQLVQEADEDTPKALRPLRLVYNKVSRSASGRRPPASAARKETSP